jgi:hypothetical protein
MEGIEEKRKEQNSKPQAVFKLPKMIDSIEEWTERTQANMAANKALEAKKGATP